MYIATQLRVGTKIEIDNEPYIVVDCQHVKPGKGMGFVRTKLKNLMTGIIIDKVFKSNEKIARPDLEEREMQFLYKDDSFYYFMDMKTYEQYSMTYEQLGDTRLFLPENEIVTVLLYKGQPISIELPNFVVLKVVETEPGVKGDTVSAGSKPAKLETGATINVPLFIETGDLIRVDTRTKEYVERAK